MCYQLTKLYELPSLAKEVLRYIERCFTMLVGSQNFLELDFTDVCKILASSQLNLTSELEVVNAGDLWMKYNIKERGKFGMDLLLKARLPLLSDHALKCISKKYSSFHNNKKCKAVLKQALNKNVKLFENKPHAYFTSRHCVQNNFSILICGGHRCRGKIYFRNAYQIDGRSFNSIKTIDSMPVARKSHEVVCIKGEIYVFGGKSQWESWDNDVVKFSPVTDTWEKAGVMRDGRKWFCVCAFMDKIFMFGGSNRKGTTSSCLQLDPDCFKWKKIAAMNEAREVSACAVFEGRIVVCGGIDNNSNSLNSVESYDAAGNKWSRMPNMINRKSAHSLVAAKNKLFVFSNSKDTNEVFDEVCKKFVALKSPNREMFRFNKAVSIGNKIVLFQHESSTVLCYDVDKDEWSEDSCYITENINCYSCVRVPKRTFNEYFSYF